MGGEREDVIESSAKGSKAGAVEVESGMEVSQLIRIHEDKGQVHFHVDKEKLKVAVPVPVWWKAWEEMSTGGKENFYYIDTQNKAVLFVDITIDDTHSVGLAMQIAVRPLTDTNSVFDKLKKFTEARK